MPRVHAVGCFPPTSRVRKRSEYRVVQTHGKRVHTEHFVFLFHARDADPSGPPRLGVVVSRKIGHAVQRNRAKRLIREAFRANRQLWSPGIDVVVIVRRAIGAATLATVATEWLAAADKMARQTHAARRQRQDRVRHAQIQVASQ